MSALIEEDGRLYTASGHIRLRRNGWPSVEEQEYLRAECLSLRDLIEENLEIVGEFALADDDALVLRTPMGVRLLAGLRRAKLPRPNEYWEDRGCSRSPKPPQNVWVWRRG